MRFLHTSDWHLGASDQDRSLYEDQKFFIDRIFEIIEKERVDAVLHAGDVYDRSIASAEAVKLYDYAMTGICQRLKTPVFLIAGNHDSSERLSSCRELLSESGLHVCGSVTDHFSPVSIGDTDVYMLPWITEERIKSVFPSEKDNIRSLEDAYRIAADRMRGTFVPDRKHILLSHAFLTKAETSTSDRAAVIGFATQIPVSVFQGFDYVALGHIHKPQNVGENARYSGTPMPYSFGTEEKQVKSVTVLDTDTMERTEIPLPLYHRRSSLKGTLEELLRHTGVPAEVQNGYVKLEVSDCYVSLDILSRLKEEYPNLLEARGLNYDGENSVVSVTVEELDEMQKDPLEVFRRFCEDMLQCTPDAHQTELFQSAVATAEEEER